MVEGLGLTTGMCFLKLFSDTASFKDYAAETELPVFGVHDAQDIRRRKTGETFGTHRISFTVSACEWDDFDGQVRDAIVFLGHHASEIRRLVTAHPVSEAYLDFPLWSRLEGELASQSDSLPRELIALCAAAGIGVVMSTYARAAFSPDGS